MPILARDVIMPALGMAQEKGVLMITLSLSCDHRVVDGGRRALFLHTLAELVEEPLPVLD